MNASRRATGLALALLGSIAFSGKAIIVKLAYRHGVDAFTLIMLRMLFALPLFLALAWWAGRGRPALSSKERWAVGALGFCGYYLSSTLDFAGLQYITASLERLVLYLNPTLVLLLGALFFGQRVAARQWLAMGLSYLGVLVVFGREVDAQGAHAGLGTALVFASAVSYAVYLLASGQWVQRIGSLRLTGLATSVACVLCIVQYLVLRPWDHALSVAPPVLGLSVLNALLCTFAPVLMVMMAIERIGPALTSQAGMVGPMSTLAMGVWLLGEPFNGWIVVGTALVLAGVWWVTRPAAARADQQGATST